MSETVGAAVLPQSKGMFERIIGIFISPAETMRDIAARPSWLLPLIIVAVVGSVGSIFLKDAIVQQQIEGMQKRNMTDEQIQQALPMMEKIMTYTVPLFALIVTPITYLILAGIGLFVGNVILGGETKFSTLFSVTCWSGIITVLSSLINIPVMANRQSMESATSLGSFFAAEENKTFFHHLLGQIDLFVIWWVAILGFGVAAAYKFSTKKAMTMVFVVWAIFAIVAAVFKSTFS
jgi:hypothetical protein